MLSTFHPNPWEPLDCFLYPSPKPYVLLLLMVITCRDLFSELFPDSQSQSQLTCARESLKCQGVSVPHSYFPEFGHCHLLGIGALGGIEYTDILPGRVPLTGQDNAEAFLKVLSLLNWKITLTTKAYCTSEWHRIYGKDTSN